MSYKIQLNNSQLSELKERLPKERDSKIWRRLKCIDLKHNDYPNWEIGEILDVHHETITDWCKLFLKDGFEGLCELKYEGRRLSKLESVKEKIKEHIESEMVPTLGALQHWLKETFEIEVEQSWLGRWLKKNSIFLTKNRSLSLAKHQKKQLRRSGSKK